MERLAGRVALVTGAASGIGKATAERLAAEGAAVMVTDVNDEGGKTVACELGARGRQAAYLHLEVASEREWQRAIEGVVEQFGGLDVLVNNAGVRGEPEPVEETSLASWDLSIAVLQTGVFLGMKWGPLPCSSRCLQTMTRRGSTTAARGCPTGRTSAAGSTSSPIRS